MNLRDTTKTRAAAAIVSLSVLLVQRAARGDDAGDRARARAAYDRGVAAQQRGAYAEAAREFATADALIPSATALGAALEAADAAGDVVLGAELCDRAAARSADGSAPADRRALCEATRRRVGRVTVTRDATVDGAAAVSGRAVVVLPGSHTVRAGAWSKAISVAAGESVGVEVPAPAAGASTGTASAGGAPEPSARAISWVWPLAVGGLAAVSTALTIASGIDTKAKHDAFVGLGCDGPTHGDCTERARHGVFAQDRTNVMIGVTAALVATTVALEVISRTRSSSGVAVIAGPSSAGLRVTFE